MQKLIILLGLVTLVSFTEVYAPSATTLTREEKKAAVSYLKETQKLLVKEVKGLSEKQLNWKANDSTWSVANCVEHITLAEKNIFDWAMGTLKEPANPAKRTEIKHDDETVKKMISDRSFKAKAPEVLRPTGELGNADATLAIFKQRRGAAIKYIKSTDDDLRNHFAPTPIGVVDTYQVLLFMAAHTRRHTLQIIEVKAMPGFPKE